MKKHVYSLFQKRFGSRWIISLSAWIEANYFRTYYFQSYFTQEFYPFRVMAEVNAGAVFKEAKDAPLPRRNSNKA